jgi:adenylate kinase
VDYDYYDYSSEEEETQLHDLRNLAEQSPATQENGVKWVLIGDPRTKKRVYAEKLSKLLEVPYISMGSLVRQELNPKSTLYKEIANDVNEGKLVTEDIVFALLSKRLEECHYRGENGFILDGIPRTRLQAEILDKITDVDLVVNFKCSGKELVNNNMGTEFLGTGSSNFKADAASAWKDKFGLYAEQGKQLEDYYRRQRKLLDFQVTGTAPGETWQRLLAALFLQNRKTVISPQNLTA